MRDTLKVTVIRLNARKILSALIFSRFYIMNHLLSYRLLGGANSHRNNAALSHETAQSDHTKRYYKENSFIFPP